MPIEMVAVMDEFGETARDNTDLYKKHHLMEEDIVMAAKKAISRKINRASQTPQV